MAKVTKIRNIPRVVDGEPVPNVSRREMRTLDALVDDQMESMPLELDDAKRGEIRNWLYRSIYYAAHNIEWAYRRATETALEQANNLMRDPKRYERQTRRTKEQREKYRIDRERRQQECSEREVDRYRDLKALTDEGKLALMPGLQLRKPADLEDSDAPEPEGGSE